MVSLFGFGKLRCAQCRMELKPEIQVYEWQDKKFCCLDCKATFRKGGKTSSGSCH